jgi:hypothetical protein
VNLLVIEAHAGGPTAANVEQAKRNLATMDEPAEDHTWRLFPTGHGVVAHSHSATESAQWLRRLANDIESSEVSAVATDGCPLLAFGSMDLSAQDEPHSSNSVYTQRRVWTITIKADDGV